MSHLELRFLNIETEESKQTPTFQGKSEISLKDILKDEKKMTSQNSNKELIQKNSTFKLQSEVSSISFA